MTAARRTSRRRALRAEAFPALRSFVRAYLHEDFEAEHGSAASAARAFRGDSTDEERRLLVDELSMLRAAVEGLPVRTIARFVRDELGGAWAPASLEDLDKLLGALADAGPEHGGGPSHH